MLNPPVRHQRRAIYLAIVSTIAGLSGISANVAADETMLGETVVSATRRETPIDDIPATVSTLNRQEMDRRLGRQRRRCSALRSASASSRQVIPATRRLPGT